MLRFCFLLFLLFISSSALAQAPYELRFVPISTNPPQVSVEVSGLSQAQVRALQTRRPQWQRLLAVYAGAAETANLPPMAGTYAVQGARLRFTPQFALEPGVLYRAVFHPAALPGARRTTATPLTASFQLPARAVIATTTVTQVYPSADVVPENLLKFYLHFSAPMSRGNSYAHLRLRDSAGKPVELPFLEIAEELWNPELTRLTVLIDPGRIKRGVTPLEEIGPALEAGQEYTLEIQRDWLDGQGNPLLASFQKVFRAGPADRTPLDPAQWKLAVPPPDTHEALTLTFPEPLDHALAQRVISVRNAAGEILGGTITLPEQERRWQFEPDHVWRRGQYSVVIQTTLEDLAGNNIGKAFEVDLFEGIQRQLTSAAVTLSFRIE
jgi:hypothetical protein